MVINQRKVRGAKNPNETSPTKQKMTRMKDAKASSRAFETRAKKAGYKTAQDYANVVARYGSEDNMKKGKGSRFMIEDTTPCSVENTEEDDTIEKKHHKKYGVATAKDNPFSVGSNQTVSKQ